MRSGPNKLPPEAASGRYPLGIHPLPLKGATSGPAKPVPRWPLEGNSSLAARFRQNVGALQWREFIRADNLANHRYAGSVIVNEAGGRSFKTAARRSWLIGVELVRSFDR